MRVGEALGVGQAITGGEVSAADFSRSTREPDHAASGFKAYRPRPVRMSAPISTNLDSALYASLGTVPASSASSGTVASITPVFHAALSLTASQTPSVTPGRGPETMVRRISRPRSLDTITYCHAVLSLSYAPCLLAVNAALFITCSRSVTCA